MKYKGIEIKDRKDGTVYTSESAPIIGTLNTVHKDVDAAKKYIDSNINSK